MSRSTFFAILASVAAVLAAPGVSKAEETKPAMTTETKAMPKPEKSGLLPIDGRYTIKAKFVTRTEGF